MQRRSSLEEKNPPVTIRGTLVSVFSNMGERIATLREQVHYKQAHDHAQGVPRLKQNVRDSKVKCVFPMVVVSLLPHTEFGPNDHRIDASHYNNLIKFDLFSIGTPFNNATIVCWPSWP